MTAYPKLLQYALRIISKKRYSHSEMTKKLQQYIKKRELKDDDITDEELIDSVLARLIELRYIDDEEYAKDYIAERLKFKPKGKFLLNRELRAKGIPVSVLDKVFNETNIDEYEAGLRLLVQKKDKWKESSVYEERSKAFRFLLSRGFNADVIYKIIDTCYSIEANQGS